MRGYCYWNTRHNLNKAAFFEEKPLVKLFANDIFTNETGFFSEVSLQ